MTNTAMPEPERHGKTDLYRLRRTFINDDVNIQVAVNWDSGEFQGIELDGQPLLGSEFTVRYEDPCNVFTRDTSLGDDACSIVVRINAATGALVDVDLLAA